MRLVAAFFLLALSGCAITPDSETPSSNPLSRSQWDARNADLLSRDEWTAHFSLLGVNEKQKFKTRAIWSQTKETYQIKLKDFIGRTVAIIDGNEDGVVVKTSKGQTFTGDNANQLIQDLFGIEIPVDGMVYWLRAIPLPNEDYKFLAVNDQGLVQQMSQAGWVLSYNQYQQHDVAMLPNDTVMQFDQLMLTVKVSRWEFPES